MRPPSSNSRLLTGAADGHPQAEPDAAHPDAPPSPPEFSGLSLIVRPRRDEAEAHGEKQASAPRALRRRAEHAEHLLRLNTLLIAERDPEALPQLIIESATEVLGCEAASLLLFHPDEGALRFAAATGADADSLAGIPVPLGTSLAGQIFTENRPIAIGDVTQEARHFSEVGEQVGFETRALIGVPVRLSGRPIGVLEALNKTDGPFTRDDIGTLSIVATQAAVAIRNARQVKRLEAANAQLNRLDTLKSDFLALASHELRTPLSAILGYSSVLEEELAEPLREFAGLVTRAASDMRRVVETMSHMEALRSDAIEIRAESMTVAELLRRACASALDARPEARKRLQVQLPASPLRVDGDPERLALAVSNLIRNALQFSPSDTPVVITAQHDGDTVHLAVRDEGVGVAEAHRERIFEDFFQVEDHLTRSHGGLGLGLTLARELVRLHGGSIRAESPGLGHGTTLHLTLPCTW